MCGCNKCQNNPCDECGPKPCKCHPCYKTMIGDCKQPCDGTNAGPIDSCMTNAYCDDGCAEFLDAKCIQFEDGESLEDKWDNLIAILADIKSCVSAIGGETIIRGCTDPTSTNYNPNANVDDGSCQYNCLDSGVFNTSMNNTFCSGTIDLNQFLIGAGAGGTWSIGGCGSTIQSNVTWSISGSNLTQLSTSVGVHTFSYTLNAPNCPSSCTEITLEVCDRGNPGTPTNFSLPLGSNQTVNLNDYLTGEDQGGTWYLMGQAISNPTVPDTSSAGNWVYTYKVNEECCGGTFADVGYEVTNVNCADITSGTLTLTQGDESTYNLMNSLSGFIPGGSWTDYNGDSTQPNQIFEMFTPGTYVYTYAVTVDNCPEVTATVTVVIEEEINPPCIKTGTAIMGTVCVDGSTTTIDIMSLLSGADSGGDLQGQNCNGDLNPSFIAAANQTNVQVDQPLVIDFAGAVIGTYTFSYVSDCECTDIIIEAESCDFTYNSYEITDEDGNALDCCEDGYYVKLDIIGEYQVKAGLLELNVVNDIVGPLNCGNDTVLTIYNDDREEDVNIEVLDDCTYMSVCIEDTSFTNPVTQEVIVSYTYSINIENPFLGGEYNGETITVAPTATITDASGNVISTYTSDTNSSFITWIDSIPDNLGTIVNYQITTTGGTYTIPQTITYGTDIVLDQPGTDGTPNECDLDIPIDIVKT